MALNRIEAWLRIRDRARFSKDAKEAAHDIKNIGDAADKANSPIKKFGGALSDLGGDIQGLGGRTRLFGLAIGTVVTGIIALIPVVIGLGGAITALAGSFTLAGLALGGLSVAAAGVLALPLAGLTLVGRGIVNSYKKISLALEAYRLSIHQYGKDSEQAATAQEHLRATVEKFGGKPMLQAVKTIGEISTLFKKETAPAVKIISGLFYGAIQLIRQLMPVIAAVINIAAGAIAGPLKKIGAWLASPAFTNGLMTIAQAFAQLAGPLIGAALSILQGFFNLTVRLSPVLLPIANGIAKIADGFNRWTTGTNFAPLIAHLMSWWNLMKAIGKLFWIILKAAAPFGKILVDALTKIVGKWNAWLQTSAGQKALASFFKDAVEFTKQFVKVIAFLVKIFFAFGRAALPIYTKAIKIAEYYFGKWMEGIQAAMPFIKNVLLPIIKGIADGILGGIVGALNTILPIWLKFAQILGWVGSKLGPLKGVFHAVGYAIGFIFGGEILKAIELLGKLNVVFRPLAGAIRLLRIPLDLLGGSMEKLLGWAGKLLGWGARVAPGLFNPLKKAIWAIVSFMLRMGTRFFDAGVKLWGKLKSGIIRAIGQGLGFALDVAKAVGNFIVDLLNSAIPNSISVPYGPDIDIPDNPIPKLASGGIVSGTGSWITGEAGPELNTLRNGRVHVQPLPAIQTPSATGAVLPDRGKRTIVTKVYLRGKQIAEAIAEEADDQLAAA